MATVDRAIILFVDDESFFLESLKRILRQYEAQWEMHFVTSAAAARNLAESTSLDVIISDITMPDENGLELLQSLKTNDKTKDIPVVILTGNAETSLKREALELGATDLLNKPIITEDLIARINSVLKMKSFQDRLKNHSATLEQEVLKRTKNLEILHRDIVWRLAKAGELRDEDTGNHVVRVALHSQILAQQMGMRHEDVEMLFLTAPLHDVGKIGIPDAILLKPDTLTQQERVIMESHCQIGADILLEHPRGMKAFLNFHQNEIEDNQILQGDAIRRMAGTIVMCHHEKWDGSGYPQGLAGEKIPVEGRIVALADVFDALCSKRPYKDKFHHEDAREIIVASSGTHFDPDIVSVFEQTLEDFLLIRKEYAD